jgi:hypothetical protein
MPSQDDAQKIEFFRALTGAFGVPHSSESDSPSPSTRTRTHTHTGADKKEKNLASPVVDDVTDWRARVVSLAITGADKPSACDDMGVALAQKPHYDFRHLSSAWTKPLALCMSILCKHNRAKTLRLLTERGLDVNRWCGNVASDHTPMLSALRHNTPDCLRVLIEAKADVNAPSQKYIDEFDNRSPFGDTPLFLAAKNARTECVRILIDAKADVNYPWKEQSGDTPLMEIAILHNDDCSPKHLEVISVCSFTVCVCVCA